MYTVIVIMNYAVDEPIGGKGKGSCIMNNNARERAQALLKELTLDEKIRQVTAEMLFGELIRAGKL